MKYKSFIILVVGIVLLASLPRGIELINVNYLFGFDQGLFYEAVKKIVVDHRPTLIGSEVGGGGFFQGPGWYYLLAIPFVLFRGDPYGGMVLMFIIGLLTVFLAIILARRMFDLRTGLLVGFLIAISPEVITQSRFIWSPFPVSLLTVLALYFLFRVLERKGKFFPLLTFTVGLMSHFEIATTGLFLAQLIIFAPVLLLRQYISIRYIAFGIGSFILTLAPLIIFDLRHDFLNAKGVVNLLLGRRDSWQAPFEWVVSNHFDVFRANFFSTFEASFLWPLLLAILVFGTIVFLRGERRTLAQKAFVFYLATSPILFFLILLFYRQGIWGWWILPLHIFYSFLFGILLLALWKKPFFKPIVVAMLLIFVISFVQHTSNLYKSDLYDFGGVHKIKGKIEAIDYIYKDAKGEKFGLLVFTPPIYTYAYDYLVWWYGRGAYDYIPHQEEKGTFYLLIEPDFAEPWRHIGWLETVIKTGKVIERKELPSNFIIEKRIEEG